jgi:hypothetical protein
MIVKIEKYFKYPNLIRQTPNLSFKWKEITFTEEDIPECDYLVILDHPKKDFYIKVNPQNVIHICLEPPNEISKYRQYGNKEVSIIYNQMSINKPTILSHGVLPWHIDKDYDFLSTLKCNQLAKSDKIVWITSNQRTSKGHKVRMNFLDQIRNIPFIELYGRGINPINDKWDALSTSKYSIAYENYENEYYWTEKIIDSFLSFSMPLYFGCKSITNFFPKDSYIQIDPADKHIKLFLKELLKSNTYERNIESISLSRHLILDQYQLFPFLYQQIHALESVRGKFYKENKKDCFFKGNDAFFDNYPFQEKAKKTIRKIKQKIY